ncbi:hypothetical protein yc1106_03257 [Curvularia clavata]|uniref:Ubiquitin-like protease family profile domain-containing protein n=1 Tax=Curvularia clavata TaxID=95742 RepID=A0A9Q9DQ70_CURCL|nr:hypothetical protein yc1106_03257 [Curvularia clavata]
MSNKRSYSAFLSSAPEDASDTLNGFDAHQLHAQQSTTSQSPYRHIPGAWPEGSSVFQDVAPEPPSPSVFTTVSQWVSTMSISTLLSLPRYIANSFLRPQNIKAVSIISSTGSSKRRFVAACLADNDVTTRSPSERARAHQARRQNQTRAFSASQTRNRTTSPQQSRKPTAPVQPITQLPITHIGSGPDPSSTSLHKFDTDIDDDADTSIDFSFEDILTSTPPRNPQTDSPLHISWNSPQTLPSASHVSPVLRKQPKLLSPLSRRSSGLPCSVGQVFQKPASSYTKGRMETARQTIHCVPKKPTTTPLRRQLVKLQLITRQQHLEATRQAESLIETADQGFTESEPTKITPAEAVDQDLSYLPDAPSPLNAEVPSKVEGLSHDPNAEVAAPEFEYENDLSFLADAPSPRRVRWTKHAGTKSFYYDEKVSDMLDSTLEIIQSSPVRGIWHNFQYDEQTQSDDTSPAFRSSSAESPKAAAVESQVNDGGFHGVPPDTFDASDDSLEESALSLELVQDLQNEFKAKLALAPPPPPPKPLITPLSAEEREILHTAAANTSNGLKADKWVIEQKLYARDFATLLPRLFNGDPRAWLNDNIVNEYLSILVAAKKKEAGFIHKRGGPAPPVHAFSSFWYSTPDTSRWSNRFQLKGKQYLDAQLILYPICDRGHWRLLAVYPQKRSIEYLDSMDLSGEPYLDKLDEYLQKELGDLYIADEWTKSTTQRSTQQMNGSDCGVFTLMNALALLRGDDTKLVLATNGMDEARRRIAATLLAGHPTTELD